MRIFSCLILILAFAARAESSLERDGFVNLLDIDNRIQVSIRYATEWNFLGRRVNGYESGKCFLTRAAAEALSKVQEQVEKQGFGLLVFDCYRPQRAVDDFVRWVSDPSDVKMREVFYPEEPKRSLVARGYIASRSGHSRGSTVDLTLIKKLEAGASPTFNEKRADCRFASAMDLKHQVDMGTAYDCFSELSHTESDKVSEAARKNRRVLRSAMEKHGFTPYSKEWWHFTLRNEPHKKKYFDHIVK